MGIVKELPDLVKAEVIDRETADKIAAYYNVKKGSSTTRLFVVFGILGAILIGLGIVLIVAHNWDELSKPLKLFFAFLPLVTGQALCLFTLLRKKESEAWRESASAFLFFAIGACISLVSQIYNIPGNLSSFMATWMLLCLPVVFLMNSSVTSLLYLAGITFYACEAGYWSHPTSSSYLYWGMCLGALVHYCRLYRAKPQSNFMVFHNWFVPLSVLIALGTLADKTEQWMYVAYICLLGLFYVVGNLNFIKEQKTISNGYRIIGSLGTVVVLLMLSFNWFWEQMVKEAVISEKGIIYTQEIWVSASLFVLASVVLYLGLKRDREIKPFSWVFVVFVIAFGLYKIPMASMVLVNVMVFVLGVLTIREGALKVSLGILNYGLLIITALVACRFFDSKISFVVRGIMFVLVGIGFFVANYVLLKKRKDVEEQ